ncbi:dipeptide/oligopeptide/nickel ABC transporter ATP-binding protein [Clostridium sp. chh4-2]|uniref:ABC transporter ATP-binding protein n=1 Tax=Clostridium sp. chh4-2 TaxID=2067550 RepID=UPI000CCDCAD2|nr:ABC transporter ATP-binding protein [Clostridium sp. chh4-2]PNV60301.1 dipeptide/oligopeptide/nickel ABC transporter ATP-binding protein [Clostridium sp. chh4-2]
MDKENVLSVKDLHIHYITRNMGTCRAVNGVSFNLAGGETLGLVGETGAGKTTIARGIMRLVSDPPGKIISGSIEFKGEDLLQMPLKKMKKYRGNKISMIFQDPMTALNPIDPVGMQIMEVLKLHSGLKSKADLERKAGEMLELVGIPAERLKEYPHQFSGGMKQRIVIAIALACSPELLIADEPTTALDVTIQAQILDLMNKLKSEMKTSMILITHDLGVVAEMCDKIAVVYAGEIVEYGTARQIYKETAHPYTIGLFESLPSLTGEETRLKPIMGMMPDPSNLPSGCYFHPRCPYADKRCEECKPELLDIGGGHLVRCGKTGLAAGRGTGGL